MNDSMLISGVRLQISFNASYFFLRDLSYKMDLGQSHLDVED